MSHLLRPQGKVAFIGRGNAQEAGFQHFDIPQNIDALVLMSAVESKCITQGRIKMHHLGRRFSRWISVVVARVKW